MTGTFYSCVILSGALSNSPTCHPERSEAESKDLFRTVHMMKEYYVYFLTNWNNKVMYIGVTGNLRRRIYEHKNELVDGFTKRYHIHKLVYFEQTSDVNAALEREKQLKKWTRAKKNRLVETVNPEWNDISADWE